MTQSFFATSYDDIYRRIYLSEERDEGLLLYAKRPCRISEKYIERATELIIDTWETGNPAHPLGADGRLKRIEQFSRTLSLWFECIKPSSLCFLASLIYMLRLKEAVGEHSRDETCATSIFGTALMIAYKYLDAFAKGELPLQNHQDWAELISGRYDGEELMAMEVDFIRLIDDDLSITNEYIDAFVEEGYLNRGQKSYGLVPGSLDFLSELYDANPHDLDEASVPVKASDCLEPELCHPL